MTKKDVQNDEIIDEQRLLNHASLDDLIKIKMEQEINEEFKKSEKPLVKRKIVNIAEVPVDLIFSKAAIYKVFNRVNKVQTFINGVQAESMLGMQNNVRTKLKAGLIDAFSTETAYVKFEQIEI